MFRIRNYNKKESKIESVLFESNSENTIIGRKASALKNNGNSNQFNWSIPYNFKEFGKKGGMFLVCIPDFNTTISKLNISILTNYDNGPNSNHDYYSEYNTLTQKDFYNKVNINMINSGNVIHIPFNNIVTNIKPLSTGSIMVKHNDVAGIIYYLGINLIYRRKN